MGYKFVNDTSLYDTYRSLYLGMLFSFKTPFKLKWLAIRSLYILRKLKNKTGA
jgi:hypothetical protein